MTKPISIRLSEKLAAKLDELVALTGRRRAWLIQRMIDDHIDQELWEVAQIKEAMDDYRAGKSRSRPHDEVMAELDQMLREKLGDAEFERLVEEEKKEHSIRTSSSDARSTG